MTEQDEKPEMPSDKPMRGDVMSGLMAAWPICLGYVPLGMTLGVLGQKAGLGPIDIGAMSLFVFAGSAQYIAVAMIMTSASSLSIILTTFIVNLRHLLMSSALSLFFKGENKKTLTFFAYTITDESFVINTERFNQGSWNVRRAMVVNYTAYASWILSTICGGLTGRFIADDAFGMNYAMTAMFICLLVLQVKMRIHVVTGLLAGLIAVLAALNIPGNGYIIIGSVLAATIGAIFRSVYEEKRKQETR